MNPRSRSLQVRRSIFITYLLRCHTRNVNHNFCVYVRSYFVLTQPYTTILYKKIYISQGSKMLHALGAIIVVNEYLLLPPWHAQCI